MLSFHSTSKIAVDTVTSVKKIFGSSAESVGPFVPKRRSMTPCSPPSRRGLGNCRASRPPSQRPALTGLRAASLPRRRSGRRNGLRSNKETDAQRRPIPRRDQFPRPPSDRRTDVPQQPVAIAGSKGFPVFRTPKHRTSSLRIAATTICLGLRRPLDFSRVTNATIAGLYRIADSAGM